MTKLTANEKALYAGELGRNPLISEILGAMRSETWRKFLDATSTEELLHIQADVLAINSLENKINAEIAVGRNLERQQEALDKGK